MRTEEVPDSQTDGVDKTEHLSVVEEKKTCMGKRGENREHREEMLAVVEKEVMGVSCHQLCCRLVNRKCQGRSEKYRCGSGTELRPARSVT